ncbi:MAG: metal ABC transporter solute-binding protein, Zn/Mn family [Phycisphaeraceae bacterium]
MLLTLVLGAVLVSVLALPGCDRGAQTNASAPTSAGPDDRPYTIVTTTGMIADIAKQVAGEHAEVSNLIGEGVDPHLFTPTRSDVIALQNADVVLYNGLMLEGKMADVLVRLAGKGKPVIPVAERLRDREDYVITTEEEYFDPHVWMDVRGWMTAVELIADELGEYDPDHAEDYQTNAEDYLDRLEELDAYVRNVIGSIPETSRVLVTAHDAFGYMGRAYDLEVRGIQGLSTESEAGVRDVRELVDLLVDRDIAAVFVETSVADDNVKALIEGAAARGHKVRIGGELFSDAMGEAGTYRGTYLGMLDHNATTIARALGGDAPADGWQGKLTDHGDE